jgi:hypothetical protein
LKASGNVSARKNRPSREPSDQPPSEPRSSPTNARQFELSGASEHPDPAHFAYRKDLADIALAGTVIASHYAAPVDRKARSETTLFEGPTSDSAEIMTLAAGDPFALLDDSLGWAWGYAGKDRRVGYVRSDTLA